MYTEYTLGGAATLESQWLKSSTIAKECEVQKLSGQAIIKIEDCYTMKPI